MCACVCACIYLYLLYSFFGVTGVTLPAKPRSYCVLGVTPQVWHDVTRRHRRHPILKIIFTEFNQKLK